MGEIQVVGCRKSWEAPAAQSAIFAFVKIYGVDKQIYRQLFQYAFDANNLIL